MRGQEPRFLFGKLKEMYFEERRKPHVGLFFDLSVNRKGQQSLQNRPIIYEFNYISWYDVEPPVSNDVIRAKMKQTFYNYLNLARTVSV